MIVAALTSSLPIAGIRQLIVGDLILAGAMSWMFFFERDRPLRVAGRCITVFGPPAIAFAASIFVANLSADYVPIESVLTSAKLALYVLAATTLVDVLDEVDATTTARLLRRSLTALVLLSVAQQVAHRVGVDTWPFATYASGRWDRSSFPRSASIFSEPAYLSIFVVVATFRLHLDRQLRRSDLVSAVVLLGLAASLAGAAMAIGATVVALGRSSVVAGLLRLGPWLAIAAIAIMIIPTTREIVERRVFDRVEQTADGTDASGTARLVDSWNAATTVAGSNPFTGVGLGQLAPQLAQVFDGGETELDERLNEAGGTWNVVANVFAETGFIGLFALVFALQRFGIDRPGAAVLLLVCFATGTFAGWLWWASAAIVVPRAHLDPAIDPERHNSSAPDLHPSEP